MALTLISEPIFAVTATPDYCAFNSVNRRIEFKFQRKDYLKTSGFTIVNTGGYVGLDLVTTTATNAVAGDVVYFYSGSSLLYTTGFYNVLSVDTVNNKIVIDLPYSSVGHADDWFNLNADRANYYLELRMAVNGSYYSQKASADSTGLITIDVSGILRRLFDMKDDFEYFYTYQGKPIFLNDSNQFLKFNIRYYEKYTGSTDGGTNVSRDYFAINSTPNIHEDSNAYKYYLPKLTKLYHTNWLNLFSNPTFFNGYPFDLQIIVESVSGVVNYIAVEYRDENKIPLPGGEYTNTIPNSYGVGIKRINAPFHKLTNYFGTRTTGYLIYWIINFFAQNDSEQLWMRYDNNCRKSPVYVKWLNKLGGWSYWLFSSSVEQKLNIDGGGLSAARIANQSRNNQREYIIPGQANEIVRLYDNELKYDDSEAWIDFMSCDNVFMLNTGIRGGQYSQGYSLQGGTYKLTIGSTVKHNLKIGDYVQFFPTANSTTLYPYKYIVTRIWDDDLFEIDTYYITQVLLPTDAIWSKVIDANDWTLCRKENQSSNINSANSNFSLAFDLVKPGLIRRLK